MLGKQIDFVHLARKLNEDITYNFVKGINEFHIGAGREIQAKLFSQTAPLGLLVT